MTTTFYVLRFRDGLYVTGDQQVYMPMRFAIDIHGAMRFESATDARMHKRGNGHYRDADMSLIKVKMTISETVTEDLPAAKFWEDR